jgi:hypothetical protein
MEMMGEVNVVMAAAALKMQVVMAKVEEDVIKLPA